jgi:dTMP kinase
VKAYLPVQVVLDDAPLRREVGNARSPSQSPRLKAEPCYKPRAHDAKARLPYDLNVAHRGKFITFEGLDGCGKSTQLERLAAALRGRGVSLVVTREPGGTETGEEIRRILLHTRTSGLSPLAELALMFASRAQHLKEVIEPALAAGRVVLCDRFTDSTEAYQGGGRKLGTAPVLELHRILCGNLQPDLTILMDSEVAASVERARRRNQSQAAQNGKQDENRFEQESRAFFGRVHHAYLAIAEREPERVALVDARGPADETQRTILEIVRRKLKLAAKTA